MPDLALRFNLYTIDTVSPKVLTTAPHCVSLHPDQMAAPLLCPLPDGSGVLLEDWTDDLAQPFHVPASLMNSVRLALNLSQILSALAILPAVQVVTSSASHILVLEDGERLPAEGLTSPCLYSLSDGSGVLLADWKTPDCPAYRVPAHLCGAVRVALKLKPVGA